MGNLIKLVLGMRSPAEVFQAVVGSFAISVQRLTTIGAWSVKCGKYEPVHKLGALPAISPQRDKQVPVLHWSWRQQATAPFAATVGDPVKGSNAPMT